jgi:hypothetical protein
MTGKILLIIITAFIFFYLEYVLIFPKALNVFFNSGGFK